MLSDRAVSIVFVGVVAIWGISVFVPLFAPGFDSGPVGTVCMSIAGGILGLQATMRLRGSKDERQQNGKQLPGPEAPTTTDDGTTLP